MESKAPGGYTVSNTTTLLRARTRETMVAPPEILIKNRSKQFTPPIPGEAMDRILVVEDDRAVQKALRRLFESEGYAVESAFDGVAGLGAFRSCTPAAVVLDLRLPKMSGQDVCRQIKDRAPSLPIIVLSATSDVVDKVLLLEMGADDYVTKPFSPRELLARVRAAVRRTVRHEVGEMFAFDGISINFAKMEVLRGGQPIEMTAREFSALKFLVLNAERVIS